MGLTERPSMFFKVYFGLIFVVKGVLDGDW